MNQRSMGHLVRDHRQIEEITAELESLLDSHQAKQCWMAEQALAFPLIAARFAGTAIIHLRGELTLAPCEKCPTWRAGIRGSVAEVLCF